MAPFGIQVNRDIPGAISGRLAAPHRPEACADALRNNPIGRLGRAEDIANAVRFFCLPESQFGTGQTLL